MHSQLQNKDYRSDIDGLRAIAIVSVILFHIEPSILPGGFTGVDIFFVISGYLITSHILYGIYIKDDFSFKKFYIKRIKRILPALFVMTLLVMVFGYFVFPNYYFKLLGEQAFSSSLSYSNIYFYFTSGYFDLDANFKPLLHTWSLGVEEQFYLVWPAVLVSVVFLFKNIKALFSLFLFLFALSFTLNSILSDDVSAIFYLMPFRIFEFVVGGILALIAVDGKDKDLVRADIKKHAISILGIILVVSPMYYLTEDHIFPYFNALPTIIGSGLLIYTRNSIIARLLSTRLIVYVGLISYSLYLYHWPVIVFAKYEYGLTDNVDLLITVMLLSIAFATLSYHLVEKPFRFVRSTLLSASLVVLIALTIIISIAVKYSFVRSLSSDNELISISATKANAERYFYFKGGGCSITTERSGESCDWDADTQILFFGNSHNLDGYNIFRSSLDYSDKYNFIFTGNTTYCAYKYKSSGVVKSENDKCTYGAGKLLSESFLSSIDVLVVNFFRITTWGASSLSIVDAIRKINPDIKIVVIGGYIGVRPHICSELINKSGYYEACKEEKYVSYWGVDESQWLTSKEFSHNNYLYIDVIDLLCGSSKELKNCILRVGDDLIFYDGDHFSLPGSRYIGKLMFDKYKEELAEFGLH